MAATTASYYPSRPHLRRNSPLSVFNPAHGFTADAPGIQNIDVGDSSDDEIPQPMKFSALTRALLAKDGSEDIASLNDAENQRRETNEDKYDVDTPSRAPLVRIVRKPSPRTEKESGRSTPRIVQIGQREGSLRRTVSVARSREGTPVQEYVTPGPASRAVRVSRTRAGSDASMHDTAAASISRPGSRNEASNADLDTENHDFRHSASAMSAFDAGTRYAPSTIARSRNASGESAAPPGSMRVKRVPVGAGSFLRGAPVRRGFRRRDSDDHPSPNEEEPSALHNTADQTHDEAHDNHVQSADGVTQPGGAHLSRSESKQSNEARSYRAPSRALSHKSSAESLSKQAGIDKHHPRVDSALSSLAHRPSRENVRMIEASHEREPSISQPSYKPPPPRLMTDAVDDQENMPPPTFKRNKDHDFKILGKTDKVSLATTEKHRSVADTPAHVPAGQSPRRVLGAMSNNTPVRPAPPPPPKMTILDTATKTAGASTTKSKKRRQHILVNGKLFTQMNKLGKGGSSDVYCVMAENYKLFALKKVKLEDCDETAVRGYKGEIDLLSRLADVDRVVRLYDWELDESKQTLSVLMEKGDNDLNHILSRAFSSSNPKFDSVMTRFYWKEMLHCVSAVHDYDIVHSDLKPANFLMVSGQLKLIDFGIANAIDIDNTVNVHRDSHIGTPNYMSPESITDTNAPVPGAERTTRDPRSGRLMKLGKPSDVWSLGCILYQMTYGRPPFAHIANQISRVMAITNPAVQISFPSSGIGGVAVPSSLRGTLRRCLQRDPAFRPSIKSLLSDSDPWLYPEANASVAMSEELLGQIIGKVVERCRDPKRGVPGPDEVGQYPASFMVKIREMVEREGVREAQT